MKSRLAACLIVKNEAKTIGRCLDSLRGLVDAVVIVDTGSTDDTVAVICGLDFPVPVHLHERPWVDFGHNRTEAIRLASPLADYLLLLDADQTVEGRLPEALTADAYSLKIRLGTMDFWNVKLIRSALPWRYEGPVHEYLVCEQAGLPETLDSLTITEHSDGGGRPAGTQPRWERDAEVLEREVRHRPSDTRSVFYLARTYEDLASTRPSDSRVAAWREQAQSRYAQRAAMKGGYDDEVFYSLFRLGVMRPSIETLLTAWQMRPHRWEPVHAACQRLNQTQLFEASYAISKAALSREAKPSGLFAFPDVYDYLLLFEHSISAHYVGQYRESVAACRLLLQRNLPGNIRAAVERNLPFPIRALTRPA